MNTVKKISLKSFQTFDTLEDSRSYRTEYGTGGWIYEIKDVGGDTSSMSVLCPYAMTRTELLNHPFFASSYGVFHA